MSTDPEEDFEASYALDDSPTWWRWVLVGVAFAWAVGSRLWRRS